MIDILDPQFTSTTHPYAMKRSDPQMNNIPELIERLRNPKGQANWYESMCDAADALESQEAEIEMRIAGSNEVVMKLQARVKGLEAALKSIIGQTDDCDTDETYYGGCWREVNLTARLALKDNSREPPE